jgi:hypothetical protein
MCSFTLRSCLLCSFPFFCTIQQSFVTIYCILFDCSSANAQRSRVTETRWYARSPKPDHTLCCRLRELGSWRPRRILSLFHTFRMVCRRGWRSEASSRRMYLITILLSLIYSWIKWHLFINLPALWIHLSPFLRYLLHVVNSQFSPVSMYFACSYCQNLTTFWTSSVTTLRTLCLSSRRGMIQIADSVAVTKFPLLGVNAVGKTCQSIMEEYICFQSQTFS